MEPATEAILSVLPAAGEWREDDYLWVTRNTRRLVELHAGELEVLPMPTERHQAIVAAVFLALHAHLTSRGGVVRFAPMRLRVGDGRFREPDVVALLSSADPRRSDAYWSGADVIVEVLSPDDPQRDLVTKRAEYALAGVLEYWVVDPRVDSVTVFCLDGARYREHGVFIGDATFTSPTLRGLDVRLSSLFATE